MFDNASIRTGDTVNLVVSEALQSSLGMDRQGWRNCFTPRIFIPCLSRRKLLDTSPTMFSKLCEKVTLPMIPNTTSVLRNRRPIQLSESGFLSEDNGSHQINLDQTYFRSTSGSSVGKISPRRLHFFLSPNCHW